MKRILACMLAAALLLTAAAGLAEENDKVITVATTTLIRGMSFGDMFDGTTADNDVKPLLHGADTIIITGSDVDSKMYDINPDSVEGSAKETTAKGVKYTFTLKEDLLWSDGTPMTAQDYVFSVLMQSSSQMKEQGADISTYDRIVGWKAFSAGEADTFEGVELIDEQTFSMTIAAEYLPDFYEMSNVWVQPCPVAVCAPGCEVKDDGDGAYIEGEWTGDEVMEFITTPAVVSGPYRLDSFDGEAATAEFSVNPFYCGKIPEIQKLRFMTVNNEDVAGLMEDGTVDVFINAVDSDTVKALNEMKLNKVNYDRRGLAFLALNCESEPLTDVNVRRAIACTIDKSEFLQEFLGGRGSLVRGWYGIGLWMVRDTAAVQETFEYYDEDLWRAKRYLDKSAYVYAEDGSAYNGSGYRYAKSGDELEKLSLTYFQTENNRGAQLIGDMLKENCEALGIELTVREASMTTEALQYYRAEEREYDLMFIATNFDMVYDPSDEFSTDEDAQGYGNKSGLKDEKLYQLALDMRSVAAGNRVEYVKRWAEFQQYFTEILPSVPLYSNRYTAYWNDSITDFHPEKFDSWGQAILTTVYAD
ncbi:MAG: ABC transporter substrate-binding protein [Clostridia bacterium]|nr:ABC transporter substrate-binding protein [Clostridia bacterium]